MLTGTESPIVVVLSGSMEPAFYRGDVLFLYEGKKDPIKVVLIAKVNLRTLTTHCNSLFSFLYH